ncbi:MAG: hypothetical protein KAY37_01125 [Phycisphaerae bacterium]|nr:hypothetical protein [Phycisphaerae bacterium]
MSHVYRNRIPYFSLLLAATVFAAGCGMVPFLVGPSELPAELAYVVEHADDFAQEIDEASLTEAMRASPTGIALDDLGELAGCWGDLMRIPTTLPNRSLDVYQILHFEPETGKLTRFCSQDLVGALTFVIIQSGHVSINDDGRILFEVTEIRANDPETGELTDATDKYSRLPQYELRATLDNDQLKAAFVTPEDDPSTPAGFADDIVLIHKRFECPE